MKRKVERMKLVHKQSEAYERSAAYITKRRKQTRLDLQSPEIKALELVRVVLKGGWNIDQSALSEIM